MDMQKRYALVPVAAVLALVGPACTEPSPMYFEGTITSIWFIEDVFTQPNLTMDLVVKSTSPAGCQGMVVHGSESAMIFHSDEPLVPLTRDALALGQVIRVAPIPVTDACMMNAETIAIVR